MTTAAGYIGDTVEHVYVTGKGRAPLWWFGTTAPDGDATPWRSAPLGSIYICADGTTTPVLFFKVANLEADSDWGSFSPGRQFSGQPMGMLLALTHS